MSAPRESWRPGACSVAAGRSSRSGCTTLPESGADPPRRPPTGPDRPQDAPYFNPPGPAKDGSPPPIVSGFLVAMQANPLSTSVARTFLSEHARGAWKPNRGTIVYEAFTVQPTSDGRQGAARRHPPPRRPRRLARRLAGPRRRRSTSGWSPRTASGASTTRSTRWSVPTSFFDRSFARFNLYFYDQTGRTLLPDPVFIPRGEQTATNLVRGLLAGPGSRARRGDPLGAALAHRPRPVGGGDRERRGRGAAVARGAPGLARASSRRAVDQLAWTLRQVPGIERVRITVGGAPVPLPGGRHRRAGDERAAVRRRRPAARAQLWGLRGGRVVDLDASDQDTVARRRSAGPATRMRTLRGERVTGAARRSLRRTAGPCSSPADGRRVATPVSRRSSAARDFLRPSYDMFGDLWLVDRTADGAPGCSYVGRRQGARDRVPGRHGCARWPRSRSPATAAGWPWRTPATRLPPCG